MKNNLHDADGLLHLFSVVSIDVELCLPWASVSVCHSSCLSNPIDGCGYSKKQEKVQLCKVLLGHKTQLYSQLIRIAQESLIEKNQLNWLTQFEEILKHWLFFSFSVS